MVSVWRNGRVVLVDSKEFRPRKDPLVGNLMTVVFSKDDLDNMSEGTWVAIVVCLAFPGVQVLYDSVETDIGNRSGEGIADSVVVGARVLAPENHGPPVL